jgi:CheY-like chemotaxis protein
VHGNAVLVVDDDQGVRTLVCALLQRNGLLAHEAKDGKEAIEKLEAHEYAAVVLDLMMPVVSGFDVIDHLQRRRPDTPCVVVISAASPRDLARIEDKPVVKAVLRKPFDIHELIMRVQSCIRDTTDR